MFFTTQNKFDQTNETSFIRDRCCHLTLSLHLIEPFSYETNSKFLNFSAVIKFYLKYLLQDWVIARSQKHSSNILAAMILIRKDSEEAALNVNQSHKILQSFFNVQDGLDPGRDDGDRSSAEFGQIGADVETRFGASVNAADPTGHENRNSGLK